MDNKPNDMKKPSMELILYRMGEMSEKLNTVANKVDNLQRETNDKISDLKTNIAVSSALAKRDEEDEKKNPKLDVQKVILAAFALISTIVAIAFGINRTQ